MKQFYMDGDDGIGIIMAKYLHSNELLSYYYIGTSHMVYHGYFSIYR